MDSSTMFNPGPLAATPEKSLDGIPRYLFRVSDPLSSGTTSAKEVCSAVAASTNQEGVDLYQVKPAPDAAKYLNEHLWWKCQRSTCNLVSWTSSLLFALQYGLYLHKKRGEDLSNIMVLVVDSRQFSKGVFARDLEAIETFKGHSTGFYGLDKLYKLRTGYSHYNGEYLSQGRLPVDPGRSCQTSMQELIGHGLFKILPEFGDTSYWDQWAESVKALRILIADSTEKIKASDVHTIARVADTFRHLALPMVIMLLGITPKCLDVEGDLIFKEMRRRFSTREVSCATAYATHQIWCRISEPTEVQVSSYWARRLEARCMAELSLKDKTTLSEGRDGIEELTGNRRTESLT